MEVNKLMEQSLCELQDILRKVYQQGYEDGIKSTQNAVSEVEKIEYVDMGLPSGTKWAFLPQKMTYDEAISKYQLPTEDQFKELIKNSECRTGYYDDRNVIVFRSKINKKEVFFFKEPATNHDYFWCPTSFLRPNEAGAIEFWNLGWISKKIRDKSIPTTTAVISR